MTKQPHCPFGELHWVNAMSIIQMYLGCHSFGPTHNFNRSRWFLYCIFFRRFLAFWHSRRDCQWLPLEGGHEGRWESSFELFILDQAIIFLQILESPIWHLTRQLYSFKSHSRHLSRQIRNPAACAAACQQLDECDTFMFYGSRYCDLRKGGRLVKSKYKYTSGWCPKGENFSWDDTD